ncbi:TetR/AcrR family transcriptional regulator [Mycolicibacterium chitae]|nr:TetR/AcrR family transcriptional regulator [Mycolicibacterium chitae]
MRETILDAAEVVFSRAGYEGARLEEVAAAADISVGSIYTHFDGKRDVYLHLVERSLALFAEYMARGADDTLTPLQQVLAGGDAYLRFHLEHPGAFHFLAHRNPGLTPVSSDDDIETRIREQVSELLAQFAATIDRAVAVGEARPVDSARLTRFLWGAWNGVIALRLQPDGLRLTDAEIVETLELARWLLREGLAASALRDENGEVGDRVPLPRIH